MHNLAQWDSYGSFMNFCLANKIQLTRQDRLHAMLYYWNRSKL